MLMPVRSKYIVALISSHRNNLLTGWLWPFIRVKQMSLPTPAIKTMFFVGQMREESFFYHVRDLQKEMGCVFKLHTPVGPMSKFIKPIS
jgi:hypothetical protein